MGTGGLVGFMSKKAENCGNSQFRQSRLAITSLRIRPTPMPHGHGDLRRTGHILSMVSSTTSFVADDDDKRRWKNNKSIFRSNGTLATIYHDRLVVDLVYFSWYDNVVDGIIFGPIGIIFDVVTPDDTDE